MKKQPHPIKNTFLLLDQFVKEHSGNGLLQQQYRYIRETPFYGKAIAAAAHVCKDDYQPAMVALLISQISSADASVNAAQLIERVGEVTGFSDAQMEKVRTYVSFLACPRTPESQTEKVLLDTANVHLALADSFEWLAMLRQQLESQTGQPMEEVQWEQYCYDYYLNHGFYTRFAREKWGRERNRSFAEIEKRLEKLNLEAARNRKGEPNDAFLSDKEGENLFKVAFRNYLNLVAMTDRKAHLLIQVNAILASVIIGFTIKRADNTSYFLLPTILILLVAGLTIFYAIMASKPLGKFTQGSGSQTPFFFGSFDRIDPNFRKVSWENYFVDIQQLFKGNKEVVFNELIKESFQVRKVLAQKFGFLATAYRIFIGGQLVSIAIFLIMLASRS